ncbi:MAG: helix-turn-helix domain-containing protein [Oscillospiraceae bacterium]
MISEKIKTLRKQAKLSQEQLAEKLNVSRQAVTKWETGAGIPDIENFRTISMIFGVSLDELLETSIYKTASTQEHLYNSITEYDMDGKKHYDIIFSGAKQISMLGYDGEKIKIQLSSDLIGDIQKSMKVKIDDIKKRIDIDIKRIEPLSEVNTKKELYITIWLPEQYTKEVELSGNIETLFLSKLKVDNFEFSGKVTKVELNSVSGHIELNANNDAEIYCDCLNGTIDINQISATSKLFLPEGTNFKSIIRGINNHIMYNKGGTSCDNFSLQGDDAEECENVIELNGMKSELVICATSKEV